MCEDIRAIHGPSDGGDQGWSSRRLRVLIADNNAFTRNALVDLVLNERSLQLVGAVPDAEEAVHLAHLERPDVALVDAGMPRGGGPKVASGIRLHSPQTRVVALSASGDRDSVLEMLRAGIDTYLDVGGRGEEILHAIHHVGRGQNRLVPDLVREMTAGLADEERHAGRHRRRAGRVRRLIRGADLEVVFQPIIDLRNGRVVAVEALARIATQPTRSPAWWIDEAWAVGLGIDLELVALRAALAHLERLPRELLLTVNASPRTFVSPELLDALEGVAARRLVVEVTEHAPVEDYDVFEEGVSKLRARGMRLAIDDAGAGFSSLGGILRLAPEFIKLDISLIRTIASDEAGRATASALIRFASDIGAEIIAEGIETQAQLQTLRGLGVAYGQGFFLARPAPLSLAGRMPTRIQLPGAGEPATAPGRPSPGSSGTWAEEGGPMEGVDWSDLADVICSLRRTAVSDPHGRAGGLRARIRALKAADRVVGGKLVDVGGGKHLIRYAGGPPGSATLRALADELERMTMRITDRAEAAQALRVFDMRLHQSIPPAAGG